MNVSGRNLGQLTVLALMCLAGCRPWSSVLQPAPVARGVAEPEKLVLISEEVISLPANSKGVANPIQRTTYNTPQPLPSGPPEIEFAPQPSAKPSQQPALQAMPMAQPEIRALPITLDTVFRLAQDQNGRVLMAREKVQEAFAARDLAEKRWLPDLLVGPAFYRHEGGIQDFNGNLIVSSFGSLFAGTEMRGQMDLREYTYKKIQAERQVWESMGELSRLSSEKLLEASTTYVDMLAALSGEIVAAELQEKMNKLLEQVKNLAHVDKGAQVEVSKVEAAIDAHRQSTRQLRANVRAAAAKLAYLLNLDPASELVPLDRKLAPFTLVDETVPVQVLVEEAVTSGPGIREMEGLLALIDEAMQKAKGPGRYLPIFQLNVAEGGFGAGPGGSSNWANRFDMALQARWNITELFTASEQRRLGSSKAQQAQLGYAELRSRLTLGVQEALESSQSRREQIVIGESRIKNAENAYNLSKYRLSENVKGASPTEVLLGIHTLAEARLKYLEAIREYNQAQLRLFVITGRVDGNCNNGPAESAPVQVIEDESIPILPPPRTVPMK